MTKLEMGATGRFFLAAAVAVALTGMLSFAYTVDDAFIVGRYARNLVTAGHYGMNLAGPASDGVTGPLWLVPGVLAVLFGVDPVVAAKVAGLLCACLAAGIWVGTLRGRRSGRPAALYASLILLLQPTYATWAVAGLETGAASLCLALCGHGGASRSASHRRGLSAGALALLRPELWPVGMLLLLSGRRPARPLTACLWGLAGPALAIASRLSVFGAALPLSTRAKPGHLVAGLDYGLRGLVLITSGVGCALVVMAAWRGRPRDRVAALSLGVGLLCIVVAGGDWMPGFRLFAPLVPPFAVLAGLALAYLHGRRGPLLASVAALSMVALPTFDLILRVPEQWRSAHARETAGVAIAAQVAQLAGPLATVDVGFIPYASGLEVVDLGGVTDAAVAALPGDHLDKHVSDGLIRDRAPRQLLLHSIGPARIDQEGRLRALAGYPVERRVARMSWVLQNFRVRKQFVYGPRYHYVWLVRSGL